LFSEKTTRFDKPLDRMKLLRPQNFTEVIYKKLLTYVLHIQTPHDGSIYAPH